MRSCLRPRRRPTRQLKEICHLLPLAADGGETGGYRYSKFEVLRQTARYRKIGDGIRRVSLGSCEFVDRLPNVKNDPRNHTNPHERVYSSKWVIRTPCYGDARVQTLCHVRLTAQLSLKTSEGAYCEF